MAVQQIREDLTRRQHKHIFKRYLLRFEGYICLIELKSFRDRFRLSIDDWDAGVGG